MCACVCASIVVSMKLCSIVDDQSTVCDRDNITLTFRSVSFRFVSDKRLDCFVLLRSKSAPMLFEFYCGKFPSVPPNCATYTIAENIK